MTTIVVVAAAVIERDGRFLVTRRPDGRAPGRALGVSRRQVRAGETLDACLARELREELAVDAAVGDEMLTTTPRLRRSARRAALLPLRARSEPRPQLGQEMRWVTRSDLAALEFPPADAELDRGC